MSMQLIECVALKRACLARSGFFHLGVGVELDYDMIINARQPPWKAALDKNLPE